MNAVRAMGGTAEIALDILVQSPLWRKEPEAETVARRAIAGAAEEASSGGAEIAIVLTDDSAIRALNRQWRGQDKSTNVLSFPTAKAAGQAMGALLGDIVIAFETTAQEAQAEGKPFADHLAHLVVHGYLHLLGHDHETERDAQAMERLETKILGRLGVADPYAGRAGDA